MHLNAKRPVILPKAFWAEVETMSKASLMDLVWDFAVTTHGEEEDVEGTMQVLRQRMRIVQRERQAK